MCGACALAELDPLLIDRLIEALDIGIQGFYMKDKILY